MEQCNIKREVGCSECGSLIMRRPNNPNTGKPIKAFFCSTKCKGEHQKRARLITKEQAEQMYLRDGMSAVDIGRLIGRDAKSVWNWMKDWGIPMRPRGADERQHFSKGHTMNVGMKMPDSQRAAISAARKADGSKSLFLPNGDHVLKGRKGKDHPSWKGGVTPLRNAFYASDEWRAACVVVWQRDDAICQNCGLDHRTIDRRVRRFHVHHINSFAAFADLRADPENLVLLCDVCHRWVHSRANADKKFIGR